ncbi:MAG TPA: nucleoside-diphosphate kinase [Phycisphaerae bacterium]|nr:nucleoside-diphosphate kinase [Phycisphaerae bacterium]HRR84357.1 nucleoside-diphosphate kinase [Phycisphaerae bacterium]
MKTGTIRGGFGASTTYNLVHGSDSPEWAAVGISLCFNDAEILDYVTPEAGWVAESDEG